MPGKQVAVHFRSYQPAGYTTIKNTNSITGITWIEVRLLSGKSKGEMPELHLLVQLLLSSQGILNNCTEPVMAYCACRKASALPLPKACELAIEYRNFSYRFVGRILQNNMEDHQDLPIKNSPYLYMETFG
ncbi:hypothetical protein CS542_06630 [Pedobacter sp. IW39]|nr:hypothetical protein CS542_06630 [Pedobacter sp. IW39]